MTELGKNLIELATAAGGKIILALLVVIIGRIVINTIVKRVDKLRALKRVDETVKRFAVNFTKGLLYIILVIAVISILGVPMASVITVLASCGVAVGLALQGALSNLAGGIMVMIFRPFSVGDYVEAAGIDGVVKEITLFYTEFTSLDNKKITVPNGSLMNANVINYSAEELRRVDLVFSCAKGEKPAEVQDLILDTVKETGNILDTPAPFARLSGGTNESMEFTVRVWCKNADYWDVYFNLTQNITEAFGARGIKQPAARVTVEQQ